MNPLDFSVNPYNFQMPVSTPDAFAGRKGQRDEIGYYLDQASKTRPTNIAIVGPRASGKTSLLNMIERDATERGIVAVRINFDESHTRSQLRFFFKIFDALVSTVLRHKRAEDGAWCFGGKGGAFYGLYIQCITSFERGMTEDLELVFPNLYASTMKAGEDARVVVPQSFFEDDLRRIAIEVGRPIALIMDECNLLVQSREILQAMRGMFQNLDRYMLILTGTNEMFPVIDDVYSPVGRGFKRVSLEGFSTPEDTFACMERPCLAFGVSTEVLKQFRPQRNDRGEELVPQELADLHNFTAGNPHEIQLACHFMFRALQERLSSVQRSLAEADPTIDIATSLLAVLYLDNSVIDKVLMELAPDEERRETLARVKALEDNALQALGLLTRVGFGFAHKTYCGFVESERHLLSRRRAAVAGECSSLTIESFEAGLHSLLATGWLCEAEGDTGYRWSAPQLEEVLLKYVARSRNVLVGRFGRKSSLVPYLGLISGTGQGFPSVDRGLWWLTPWTATLSERAPREGLASIPDRLRGRALHAFHDRCEIVEIACSTPERGWAVRSLMLCGADRANGRQFIEELERSIALANDAAIGFGVRWSAVRSTHEAYPPWGSDPSDWSVPLQDSENLRCAAWMGGYHLRFCDEFLAGKDVSEIA
jgi:hypothetical protein